MYGPLRRISLMLATFHLLSFEYTIADSLHGICIQNENLEEDPKCIVQKLLQGYDKRLRPNFPGPPVVLRVEFLLSNIFDISEVKNEFGVEIYFRQFWNDPRLQLSRFNFSKPLFLNSETINELWIPSTYFVKSKRAYRHHITKDNVLLRIRPNGDIFYSQRLSVSTSCIMNLRYFPHDTQVCRLLVESYAYQSTDIVYNWGKIMKGSFNNIQNAVFDIPSFVVKGVRLSKGTNRYSIGNHSYLSATFTFQRRVGYFLIETYIPSGITVVISWVSFWIPAESAPARVSLGITTVLTMTTISSATRQSLPKVSYVKVVDWFLLVCLVFVFAALLEYAFVVYYHSRLRDKDEILDRLRKLKTDKANGHHTTGMKLHVEDDSTDDSSKDKFSERNRNGTHAGWKFGNSNHMKKKSAKEIPMKLLSDVMVLPTKIDQIARKGFPIAFSLFLCLYCVNLTMASK